MKAEKENHKKTEKKKGRYKAYLSKYITRKKIKI
jgi:hypothetical protein